MADFGIGEEFQATPEGQAADEAYKAELIAAIAARDLDELDRIMARRAADPHVVTTRAAFAYADDAEMRATFDLFVPTYEAGMLNRLPDMLSLRANLPSSSR